MIVAVVKIWLVRVAVLHWLVVVLVSVPGIRRETFMGMFVMSVVVPVGMGVP